MGAFWPCRRVHRNLLSTHATLTQGFFIFSSLAIAETFGASHIDGAGSGCVWVPLSSTWQSWGQKELDQPPSLLCSPCCTWHICNGHTGRGSSWGTSYYFDATPMFLLLEAECTWSEPNPLEIAPSHWSLCCSHGSSDWRQHMRRQDWQECLLPCLLWLCKEWVLCNMSPPHPPPHMWARLASSMKLLVLLKVMFC